ncbi:hypothetical protein [Halovivax sp.]|uniref:hypothetical protein n=1 Tax=Halovivax sp. TaxID=1935978 RepID=UPI0025BED670|nr:hypothetical protein [Halovivax sp.]
MVAREDLIVVAETAFVVATLVLAYVIDSLTIWLVWATATAIVAGATLVAFNWGFEPPTVE